MRLRKSGQHQTKKRTFCFFPTDLEQASGQEEASVRVDPSLVVSAATTDPDVADEELRRRQRERRRRADQAGRRGLHR